MAFVQRLISLSLSLQNGVFSGGGNTADLEGLRVVCKITNAGPPSMGQLSCDVYGLSLDMMNQLTTLGTQQNLIGQNTVTVMAGDAQSGMATVFQGTIDVAFCNAQSQPDVSLHIEAHAGAYQAVQPAQPTSVQGSGDVAQIMSQLAGQMGFAFENGGVSGVQISNPYLWGSYRNQALSLAKAAGICWDISNNTLAIWPAGQPRSSSGVIISPQTGMVGYPAFNQAGIIVRTLFDPTNLLQQGSLITVQSDLTPACGDWIINQLEFDLESKVPNGQWFAIANAYRSGTTVNS
jgi:hypothetical protein